MNRALAPRFAPLATLLAILACSDSSEPARTDAAVAGPADAQTAPRDAAKDPSDAAAAADGGAADAQAPRADAGSDAAMGDAAGADAGEPDAGVDAAAPEAPPVCATAGEGGTAALTCPSGEIIEEITFASYGQPTGTCGAFAAGACDTWAAKATVSDRCVGRDSCSVPASNADFGDPCAGGVKQLAIEARCAPGTAAVPLRPFKGVANSPCNARRALGASWYYNWTQQETEPCTDGSGGEFVPMIWGHAGSEQNPAEILLSVASFVAHGQKYVLGFNEPDNTGQANMPVSKAAALWPAFDNPAIQVVSPATQANQTPGQVWFGDFMAQVNTRPELRTDVLALHWYGWNFGSCDAAASQLETYIAWAERFAGGRPIWLTEWGCLNRSAPDEATVVRFFQGALAVFARHPRVQRYAWYPWATNCKLVNTDGSLTALGRAFAAAPATR